MIATRLMGTALLLAELIHPHAAAAFEAAPPATVMMFGVFQFANPGRDMVKSDVIDVRTPANQAYLQRLATRIAATRPTDVLVECDPAKQRSYDATFAEYVRGAPLPDANEVYQIGFRVAKAAGLGGITCFDEDTVGWDSGPMFDYVKKNEPATQAMLDNTFKSLSQRDTREQTTLPLQRLLQLSNDPARDRENKNLYLMTNAVDAGGTFAGADASASWWHRNFRMYANVQKAAAPGHRVFVMAGSGHTAILRDLLAIDSARKTMRVDAVLAR